MEQARQLTVTFRCPPELEEVLPPPIPAVLGLPEWFKTLPPKAFNAVAQEEGPTVKKCPPFIDAMTYGFLIPLVADLTVDNGEFTWHRDVPSGGISNFSRSPIDFHDSSQVIGTPYHAEDRFLIKFNNFWTIETPPGYSLLITHPANRGDLPFTTLTGLVDSDLYFDNLMNFPAQWNDADFSGVLPKGTPVAQCFPVKRELWTSVVEPLSPEATLRLHNTATAIAQEFGIYRRQFRAPKR